MVSEHKASRLDKVEKYNGSLAINSAVQQQTHNTSRKIL